MRIFLRDLYILERKDKVVTCTANKTKSLKLTTIILAPSSEKKFLYTQLLFSKSINCH